MPCRELLIGLCFCRNINMKTCSKCHQPKPESDFFRDKASKDGFYHRCKACGREYKRQRYKSLSKEEKHHFCSRWPHNHSYLKTRYGLTFDEYKKIKEHCEICNSTENLCIDHDHSLPPHQFRGVLCRNCNVAIGMFNDDPKLLRKAIKYLNKTNPTLAIGFASTIEPNLSN